MTRSRFRATTLLGSLLTAIILSSLGAMGFVLEGFVRAELQRQTGEGSRLVAASIAHEISSFIDLHFSGLALLDSGNFRDSDGTELLKNAFPAFEQVLMADSSGMVFQASASSGELGFDLSLREYFRVPHETRINFVSPPFISETRYTPSSVLAHPFKGGVSIAYINLSFMSEFLAGLPSSKNKFIAVVDARGIFVAHNTDASPLGRSASVSLEPWFREHDAWEKSGLKIVRQSDGVEELLCWATVPGVSGWTVIVSEPTEKVFRTVNFLRVALVIVLVVYALVSLLLNLSVIRLVRRDIETLVRFSQEIADGSLGATIAFRGFHDFTHLAANMERMEEAIRIRESMLKTNERRLFDLLDFLPVPVILLTRDTNIELLNRALTGMLGWTRAEIGKDDDWWLAVFPDAEARKRTKEFWEIYLGKLRKGETPDVPFKGSLCCKDGSFRTLIGEAAIIADRIIVTFVDITHADDAATQMAASLKEKELLLQEVHHRIKNNMNTIKGLLTLQLEAEKNPSVTAALRDAEGRVQSIIMLYDRLYCTDNYHELSVKEYLQPLMQEVVNSFPNSGIVTVQTEIQDIILNMQFLSPLGILVNELLTNIMKHAFVDRKKGLVSLSVSLHEKHIAVILKDDGIGLPESINLKNSTGFGMMMVGMLLEQMNGTMRIKRNQGTEYIIEFDI